MQEIKSLDDITPFVGRIVFYRKRHRKWNSWNEGFAKVNKSPHPYQGGFGYGMTKAISKYGVHGNTQILDTYIEKGDRWQMRLATEDEIARIELSYNEPKT